MENQKTINLFDETTNQSSKFRTRNWIKINDESWGDYNDDDENNNDDNDNNVKFKTPIVIKKVVFKHYALFTSPITKINNTWLDYAEDIDIVVPMHNLIEYSDAYSKTSESLWQYYRDEPAIDANNNIIDFPADKNNSNSL